MNVNQQFLPTQVNLAEAYTQLLDRFHLKARIIYAKCAYYCEFSLDISEHEQF